MPPRTAALLLVALAAPARAEAQCFECSRKLSEVFTWENDGSAWVLKKASTDHFYTNGLRLQKLWVQEDAPTWARGMGWPLRKLGRWVFDETVAATGYTLGQNQYTPSDLRVEDPIIGDRPYGAWLYVGANVVFSDASEVVNGFYVPRQAHFLQLDVGIVGQGAGGRAVQATAHKIFNGLSAANSAPEPKGWHNQVGNQPALQLSYQWARQWLSLPLARFGRVFDFNTRPGFMLGNPFVVGSASAHVRAGYNILSDFGPPQHIPAPPPPPPGVELKPSPERPRDPPPPWTDWVELYVFAGVEGRGVLHNAFLDCAHCHDLYQIRRRPWVGDREFGAALRVWKVRVTWRRILRSAEFVPHPRRQTIGSWNLTWVDFRAGR
jgi:lipid A 3-O-deacylase